MILFVSFHHLRYNEGHTVCFILYGDVMAELKLLLLGTPSLQVNGQPVVIPRRKA